MTTVQVITRDSRVIVWLGQHEVPVPDSLARILTNLILSPLGNRIRLVTCESW